MKLTQNKAKIIQRQLHEKYHDSNVRIVNNYLMGMMCVIYESIFHAENLKDIKELIYGVLIERKSLGVCSSLSKTAYVFKFNHVDCEVETRELWSVWTLLHELRHHFQHTNNKKLLKIAEKDAERFSYKVFDRNFRYYRNLLEEQD